ncbi:MAG: DUF3179 domain-containing protein, partial [Solirubrobacterales bacterium]|nr:DUF3179 domain-containing protein [Solirubrobacterales bacterium]
PATPRAGFPPAPQTRDEPTPARVREATRALTRSVGVGNLDDEAVATIAASGDPRLAWVLADAMRLVFAGPDSKTLVDGFEQLTGVDPLARPGSDGSPWQAAEDHLIAWDLPAPPDYRALKAANLLLVEPGWKPFFEDPGATIDYRLLGWGGVRIDERPLGSTEECENGCIPALDDPKLVDVAGGSYLDDDRDVFGLVTGGEAVALPQNVMEIHEMVNLTLGDVRLGIPYCTLCGSAQAYETRIPEADVVLRTSGLLTRSNKVMYDLTTSSVFDTFTGEAVSGPLRKAGVTLEQVTVVRSTWGQWKAAHPETKVIAEDGGIGREYDVDPLRGRDDDGPIFPIGDVDPRLPVQARVVGVSAGDTVVAFGVEDARKQLEAGREVRVGDVEVVDDGGGLRVRRAGKDLPAHESFWFAWAQFHPGTAVWRPAGG